MHAFATGGLLRLLLTGVATASMSEGESSQLEETEKAISRVDRLERYKQEHASQGDFACLGRIGGSESYLCVHPDAVRQVLVDERDNFPRKASFLETMRKSVGDGLLTSEGDAWRRQRRIVGDLFDHSRLDAIVTATCHAARSITSEWRVYPRGSAICLHRQVQRMAIVAMIEILFGADQDDVARTQKEAIAQSLLEQLWFLLSFNRGIQGGSSYLDSYKALLGGLDVLTAQRMQLDRPDGDGLALLIDSHTGADRRCDWPLIEDELKTLLLFGNANVGASLCWIIYLLSKNPQAQSRLRQEIDSIVTDSPKAEHLSSLSFSMAVIKEAMRLYPPVWSVARSVRADCEIMGRAVEAGGTVILCQWLTHRHADFWRDPGEFRPERFLVGAGSCSFDHAYFPFGAGPRDCVAGSAILLEVLACLFVIYRDFYVQLESDDELLPIASMVLLPGEEVKMIIDPR